MIAGTIFEKALFYLNCKVGYLVPNAIKLHIADLLYPKGSTTVSYTHLTLPTKRIV